MSWIAHTSAPARPGIFGNQIKSIYKGIKHFDPSLFQKRKINHLRAAVREDRLHQDRPYT